MCFIQAASCDRFVPSAVVTLDAICYAILQGLMHDGWIRLHHEEVKLFELHVRVKSNGLQLQGADEGTNVYVTMAGQRLRSRLKL